MQSDDISKEGERMIRNARETAESLALDILRAYHREIKSTHAADTSAVERTKGIAAAFDVAEKFVKEFAK